MPDNEWHKQREIETHRKIAQEDDSGWTLTAPFIPWAKDGGAEDMRGFSTIIHLLNAFPWRLPKNARVLDLGVGYGWTSVFLAKQGYQVTGLDLVPSNVELCRKRAALEGVEVEFVVGDMEAFDLGQEFDAVVIFEALHHCANEQAVLSGCYRALKDGGVLCLGEPNWFHRLSPAARRTAKTYGWLERGFTVHQLTKAIKSARFRRVHPFYDPGPVYGNSLVEFGKQALGLLLGRIFSFPHRRVWLIAIK